MKKVLLAVDDSKGSLKVVDRLAELYSCSRPETVVLCYTQKIEGRSLMDEMLSDSEISTLKESLEGTEHQKDLDEKARKVVSFHQKALEERGITSVKTVVRQGHPADEILKAAAEEGAEMIIIGSRGKRLHTLLMGSVSREVANRAEVSVLLAK
ncbi:MAG: universal stress protein [Thermodesulfovibrionales bacterium]